MDDFAEMRIIINAVSDLPERAVQLYELMKAEYPHYYPCGPLDDGTPVGVTDTEKMYSQFVHDWGELDLVYSDAMYCAGLTGDVGYIKMAEMANAVLTAIPKDTLDYILRQY